MSNYLVAYIDIETGEVVEACSAEAPCESGKPAVKVPIDEKRIQGSRSTSIITHYSHSSPVCRYIKVGDEWKMVCR